ncbi:hypothetical protein KA062_02520, partial [Patescibacteria group bacterium]|nr:hypothetical protein [Patescibacteria group bacterium]
MANFLADLSLRFSTYTEGLKKGFSDAKAQLKTFQNEVNQTTSKLREQYSKMTNSIANELDLIQSGLGKGFKTLLNLGVATAKGISAAFIATGIGAVIIGISTALAGLFTWLKRSQEGSSALAQILGFLKGLLEGLLTSIMKVGEWLFKAFNDPKAAINDLGELIKKQLVTRFKGVVEIFAGGWEIIKNGALGVGSAISGIFSKKAREESAMYFQKMGEGLKKMNEGIIKMTTGYSSDEIKDFWDVLKESGDEGKRLAQIQNELNAKESKFIKMNADDAIKLAELKRQIADMEGKTDEEKIKKAALIEQASETQNRISQRGIILAKEKYELLVATNKL